jgi:tetratricopeptide (TPR) repeat protein
MAIRGSLKEASLPDVLQLLSMGKKTGCLSVGHRGSFGYIFFDKGRIIYASIVNRRDRLGDMLVKNGMISQDQLDKAVDAQIRRRDRKIGELLVEQRAVTQEQLNQFLRVQIEEAVYFLFTWTEGTFNFEPDVMPTEQDTLVSIGPESLLLEGARRVDEWSLIEKKIPTFDIVFEIDRDQLGANEAKLTNEQRVVLNLINGVRDVHAIFEESGLVEFDAAKAMYGLATANCIHRIGTSGRFGSTPTTPGTGEDNVSEYRQLGLALLRTGMLDDAAREFRRVLQIDDHDLPSHAGMGQILARKGDWIGAEAALRKATASIESTYTSWHNLAYVLERLGRYDEALTALDEAEHHGKDDTQVQISRAAIALRRGDAATADDLLRRVGEIFGEDVPPPHWYHYSALAAGRRGDIRRAAALLAEGLASHPESAVLANNLAACLERRGEYEEALHAVQHGLQHASDLPQLAKNLGDLHFRAGRFAEALNAYRRAVKLAPTLGPDVYNKLGTLYLRRHEQGEAERCWRKAIEIAPTDDIARKNLESLTGARR